MNYLYQLVSSIGVGVISFALSLFIAREAGASHFGQYSTALAIGSILAMVFDGGLSNLLSRERARVSEHLGNIHEQLPNIAMGYSFLAAILASIICFIAFAEQLYLGLGIIWCFWGAVITQYSSAILRGDGYFKFDSLWQLKQRALTSFLISVTVLLGYFEAWQLLLTWAIGALCANIFFKEGFRYKPFFKPFLSPDFNLYRTMLPLLWINLATTIYFRSDLILLRSLGVPDNVIGQYAAAHRLIEAVILVASPISIIIFRKVRLLHDDRPLLIKFIIKSLLICILFGLASLTLIESLANPLIRLAYGTQYAQASALLSILGWMVMLLIPNAVLTQVALALNLERSYALIATFAAIGNMSLNLIFIPEFGVVAAAYVSVATELTLLIGLFYVIFKKV